MKRMLSLFLALSLTVSMAACGSGNPPASSAPAASGAAPASSAATPDAAAPTGDATILYSNGGPKEFFEAPWLNPGSFTYNRVLFDRLIVADENLLPKEGQMASAYEMSADGKTLSFTLRDGVSWHDGDPITMDDVKWSIEYALVSPSVNGVFTSTFNAIEGADAYKKGEAKEISGIKVDGSKLTITFVKPAPDALLAFTQFAPLPKKHFDGVDPNTMQQAKYWQSPVGSGPFKVKEVQMNNYTILTPFEKYWGGVAAFDMHLNPSAGDSDANFVTNAKAGKLDYGYTKNIADVKALEGTPGLTITQVNVRYTRLFYPNKFPKKDGKPSPLADPKVRQAIRYALDLPAILDGVFDGAAVAANSMTPNGADKVGGLNDYNYDPEKAKALLAEAGWDPNTELDVVYYYTDQQTVDLMAILQNYLAQVGIKIKPRLVEGDLATILWKAPGDPVNGPSAVDWDLCYAAVAALSLHDYYDRYGTGHAINSHTPSDAKIDELLAKTTASPDPAAQLKAFQELQKYENESMFTLPLYYQPVFVVTSSKITQGASAQGNPQFNYNWNIQNWKLG